jgi:ribosomal protein L17
MEDTTTIEKPESVEQTIERLINTIESVRVTAQRAIDMIENQTRATIVQHALDKIIEKHQQSY